MGQRLAILYSGILVCAVIFLNGCSVWNSGANVWDRTMDSGASVWQRIILKDDVWHANNAFKDKNYQLAQAQYQHLASRYPRGNPTHEEILMHIGPCLYNDQVQSIHDARMAYVNYLELYPEGKFAKEAIERIEGLNAIQANRDRVQQTQAQNLDVDAERLQDAVKHDPYNADLYKALGDALWKTQHYQEACEAYLKSQKINAALKEDAIISQRLAVDENGKIVPLTPELAEETQRVKEPLIIPLETLHEYKSRSLSDVDSAREVYYNVTGLVHNRGRRNMDNVVVEIRFLDSMGRMLDVKHTGVGRMPSGSFRAFSVQADRYDNIYNIARYECYAYEQ